MKAGKLLKMCGQRQKGYLALKIIERYNMRFDVANEYYLDGYREMVKREEDEWAATCDAMIKGPRT